MKKLQGTESPKIILTPKFERENRVQPSSQSSPAPPKKDLNFTPKLSSENLTFSFSFPPKNSSTKKNEIAKQRAAAILKKKPLETSNPNLVKYRGTEAGKKRIADELNLSQSENEAKKLKLSEDDEAKSKKDYLQRMMNAKSSHDDLVQDMRREVEQKTFDRLEKKEAMEERMANTMEIKVIEWTRKELFLTISSHYSAKLSFAASASTFTSQPATSARRRDTSLELLTPTKDFISAAIANLELSRSFVFLAILARIVDPKTGKERE